MSLSDYFALSSFGFTYRELLRFFLHLRIQNMPMPHISAPEIHI